MFSRSFFTSLGFGAMYEPTRTNSFFDLNLPAILSFILESKILCRNRIVSSVSSFSFAIVSR